jgi:hypothetical protein
MDLKMDSYEVVKSVQDMKKEKFCNIDEKFCKEIQINSGN